MAAVVEAAIGSGVDYGLAELQKRTGLGKAAMRTARRKGLQVRYVAGRAFVRGEDWLSYVEQHGELEYH